MLVNNETGAVTDMPLIRDITKNKLKAPVHLHCDLVQAVGKISVDIQNWELDSASISAHKINGPRGIGLLYLRKPIEVFYSGGGQENGIRGGTENVYGAVALAECLEQISNRKYQIANEEQILNIEQALERMNRLIYGLSKMQRCSFIPAARKQIIPQLPYSKSLPEFSPYILQVAFKDIPGEVMARALDDLGVSVSTGSACSTSSPERPVLMAMGVSESLRIEGIRISQGNCTTNDDIDFLLSAISEVLKFL
jgi:cysteine desulfurase